MKNYSWQDEYDYPMSWTFWRAISCQHGFDPGPNEMPEEREPASLPITDYPQDIKRVSYQLQQARAQILHLQKKLAEHTDATIEAVKKRNLIETQGYKNIKG